MELIKELRIRNYEGSKDLELQYDFWRNVTRELKWAWKPTLSPKMFFESNQFDPRSKAFAFHGDKLVGYMSFSGHGDFVSLGYPWVQKGYEGELQEMLYSSVYGFASSEEYGGRVFAQRFRSSWKEQIRFFENKGFEIVDETPIYVLDVATMETGTLTRPNHIVCAPGFNLNHFFAVAERTEPMTPSDMEMATEYFSSVDFDFSLAVEDEGEVVGYYGVTIRPDTGFAELIAAVIDERYEHHFVPVLHRIAEKLQEQKIPHLGMSLAHAPNDTLALQQGFVHKTNDLILMKPQ